MGTVASAAVLVAVTIAAAPAARSPSGSGPVPAPAVQVPPRRVVSLVPSITEIVLALGAGDRLMARTPYDEDLRVADLPSVGGPADPGVEGLIAADPHLVVTWRGITPPHVGARLRDSGIAVHAARLEGVDDVLREIGTMGRLLSLEDEAATLAGDVEAGLDRLRSATAGLRRPRVLLLLHAEPPLSAGPGSYLHEVLERAGGRNAFADAGAWPVPSLEAVVRRDPDAIVLAVEPGAVEPGWLEEAAGWRDLTAVRKGRVLAMPNRRLTRPGPGMVGVAEAIAAFLHGDHVLRGSRRPDTGSGP